MHTHQLVPLTLISVERLASVPFRTMPSSETGCGQVTVTELGVAGMTVVRAD